MQHVIEIICNGPVYIIMHSNKTALENSWSFPVFCLTRKINNSHFVEQKGVEREQVISLLKHSDIIVNVDLQ